MRTTLWIPLFLAVITTLSANEARSIDQQITAIQNASPQERVKLMNQFKQQLASMNAKERSKSISQLREKMHNDKADEHMNSEAQRDQMQQSEHLQRMEQMQQQHAGQQVHDMEKEMGKIGENLPIQPKKPYSNYP